MSDYWNEAVQEILSAHGVTATGDQISAIADDIDGAASVRAEAEGSIVAAQSPIERVEVVEVHFSTCPECGGSGFTPCGTAHMATCLKCGGTGQVPLS